MNDNRNQREERRISERNASRLKVKWVYSTGGDVSSTPTVAGDAVFASDWGGNVFALRKESGDVLWTHQVAEYNGTPNTMSRVSPLVVNDLVVIGDNQINQSAVHNGANVMALERRTGELRWITKVDPHPAAVITGAPVAYHGVIYVGISSNEEGLADQVGYPCCTFRGSVVALDENNGKTLWRTYTIPDNNGQPGGYSGGAVWQQVAIDPSRRSLYVGVGNNYTAPQSVLDCEAVVLSDPSAPHNSCTPPDDHFDSTLALDLRTGKVKWATALSQYDVWSVACLIPKPGIVCPSPAGPDYDFGGSGPNLVGGIVGFGQKNGVYWALDPDDGHVVWNTSVGPGGTLGGIEWGTASDGQRIYVPISNNGHKTYSLANSGSSITWGSWGALDVFTGRLLWQVADPVTNAIDPGAASVANGVVYVGSYSGSMYALSARSGKVLWSFASGGSVIDGPSIADGVVYWGSGYKRIPPGIANNKLYAFHLPQEEDER